MESLKAAATKYLNRTCVDHQKGTKYVVIDVKVNQTNDKALTRYGAQPENSLHVLRLKVLAVVLGILGTVVSLGTIWLSQKFKNLEERLIHGFTSPVMTSNLRLFRAS